MLSTTESRVPSAKERSCESLGMSFWLLALRLLSTGVASSKKVSGCLRRVSSERIPAPVPFVLDGPVGVEAREPSRALSLLEKCAMVAGP